MLIKKYNLRLRLKSKMMTKSARPLSVSADPAQWSEKSKKSVKYEFIRAYKDMPYKCWHCKASSVFTAQDQKYTFEVKKASVDQRRILCAVCWSESNKIRAKLSECEEQWAAAKPQLKADKAFLGRWSGLLIALEAYVACKPDTAKKNMLSKLLANA
jgi:hypothetical protein